MFPPEITIAKWMIASGFIIPLIILPLLNWIYYKIGKEITRNLFTSQQYTYKVSGILVVVGSIIILFHIIIDNIMRFRQ